LPRSGRCFRAQPEWIGVLAPEQSCRRDGEGGQRRGQAAPGLPQDPARYPEVIHKVIHSLCVRKVIPNRVA